MTVHEVFFGGSQSRQCHSTTGDCESEALWRASAAEDISVIRFATVALAAAKKLHEQAALSKPGSSSATVSSPPPLPAQRRRPRPHSSDPMLAPSGAAEAEAEAAEAEAEAPEGRCGHSGSQTLSADHRS